MSWVSTLTSRAPWAACIVTNCHPLSKPTPHLTQPLRYTYVHTSLIYLYVYTTRVGALPVVVSRCSETGTSTPFIIRICFVWQLRLLQLVLQWAGHPPAPCYRCEVVVMPLCLKAGYSTIPIIIICLLGSIDKAIIIVVVFFLSCWQQV